MKLTDVLCFEIHSVKLGKGRQGKTRKLGNRVDCQRSEKRPCVLFLPQASWHPTDKVGLTFFCCTVRSSKKMITSKICTFCPVPSHEKSVLLISCVFWPGSANPKIDLHGQKRLLPHPHILFSFHGQINVHNLPEKSTLTATYNVKTVLSEVKWPNQRVVRSPAGSWHGLPRW